MDVNFLRDINDHKILGAEKKRGRTINSIGPDDRIIIFSTLDIDKTKSICFVAYTMVDEVFQDNKPLYEHYESPKKLKLKGIKYFTTPIVTRDLASKLKFVENENKSSNYFTSEYREISADDFQHLNKSSLTKKFPPT